VDLEVRVDLDADLVEQLDQRLGLVDLVLTLEERQHLAVVVEHAERDHELMVGRAAPHVGALEQPRALLLRRGAHADELVEDLAVLQDHGIVAGVHTSLRCWTGAPFRPPARAALSARRGARIEPLRFDRRAPRDGGWSSRGLRFAR
jgi:hypothetical protein